MAAGDEIAEGLAFQHAVAEQGEVGHLLEQVAALGEVFGAAAVRLVRENLAACKLNGEVVQTESVGFLSGCGQYDLIFLDPPYDSTLLDKALSAVIQYDKLAVGGIIVCESRREKRLPEVSAPYRMKRQRAYGKIMLTLYEREAD